MVRVEKEGEEVELQPGFPPPEDIADEEKDDLRVDSTELARYDPLRR